MKDRNKIMRFFGLHPQNDVRRRFAFTLAEGATHVDNSNYKRRFAFTLAEVLVTLGIIGVVAVLTVPNVISSYQKKVYVTQLQKAYNQLQQVFDLAMAEDEVEYLEDTELFQSIIGGSICASDDQSVFSSKLGEYMKIQKTCQPREFSDGCHDIYYHYLNGGYATSGSSPDYTRSGNNRGSDLQIITENGIIYYFLAGFSSKKSFDSENYCNTLKEKGVIVCSRHSGTILIDVNGKKGPNKQGRDFFEFIVEEKGQLFPRGAVAVDGNDSSWKTSNMCELPNGYGYDCAARIMDQGWVMDY